MLDIRFDGKLNYIIDNTGFVNVLRNADFTVPYKTGKEKYSLIFVEKGMMNYHFPNIGETKELNAGDVLYIPKKTPYIATYMVNDSVAKVLNFDIISDLVPEWMNNVIHKSNSTIYTIFKALSGKYVNSTVLLVSKIYELLYVIEKESIIVPDKYKKIIPALNEIQNHYSENKKLSYYSDMCYMSESNFRKLFKEYTGKSLIEYRNLIRISRARELINSGEYNVQEAAFITGFNNMSFFYEIFKRDIH